MSEILIDESSNNSVIDPINYFVEKTFNKCIEGKLENLLILFDKTCFSSVIHDFDMWRMLSHCLTNGKKTNRS